MTQPQLYDTFSRTLRPLTPADGKRYRFYCCGPTVYGPAHIGNFRTFILQDVFRRMLEVAGLNPLHVRNITDVDDKTIARAQSEGVALESFTQKWTDKFHADCEALNLLPPHEEPRAVTHIPEQIEMIAELVKRGHAYAQPDGSVYFKVSSFEEYGQLARLDRSTLQTQETNSGEAANLADEYDRESVSDFALWKATKPEDGANAWDSPWGRGRPGWHIECSAMARKYLGETFDLHGGGIDLTFPHHENEIAQSRCCTGEHSYAHHWFHCAHLMVEGQKMSKSLGNLYTLADLQEKGYTPAVVRYALMNGHYRQPLNFTFNSLNAAKSALEKLEKETARLLDACGKTPEDWEALTAKPTPEVFEASDTPLKQAWNKLADDLNIPATIGALFSEIPFETTHATQPERTLTALANLLFALGIRLFEGTEEATEAPAEVLEMAQERWNAKQARDFAKADALRDALKEQGWIVKDSKDGYTLEKS